MTVGTPAMMSRTTLSKVDSRLARRRRRGGVLPGVAVPVLLAVVADIGQPSEAKIDVFCFWMLLVRPSMSFGFLMNVWIAGIITLLAKSGRVSRSMNWEMFFALPTNSTAFFCKAV